MFLKIKFKKLSNEHKGQQISQDEVWKLVVTGNIPKEKWKEFILEELKKPNKLRKIRSRKINDLKINLNHKSVQNFEVIKEELDNIDK
jgi:hypothetical protein